MAPSSSTNGNTAQVWEIFSMFVVGASTWPIPPDHVPRAYTKRINTIPMTTGRPLPPAEFDADDSIELPRVGRTRPTHNAAAASSPQPEQNGLIRENQGPTPARCGARRVHWRSPKTFGWVPCPRPRVGMQSDGVNATTWPRKAVATAHNGILEC